MPLGPHAEKFSIVRNDHGRTQKCGFSVLDRKYPFWANLFQKMKIFSLIWNLVLRLTRIWTIPWWYSLFPFSTENLFCANFAPKFKIGFWKCNLVRKLIQICAEFNGDVHFLLFLTENILLGEISSKKLKMLV